MDATFFLLLIFGLFFMSHLLSSTTTLSKNSCLELKVDLILKHLGLDANQAVNDRIAELVKAGQKIQAIKLWREHTGVGLKEAKDYVEGIPGHEI